MKIGEGIRLNAIKYENKTAVIFRNKKISFNELNSRSNKLANALMEMGLKKGERVGVLLHNCSEYVEIGFGLAKAGMVLVPISYRFVGREIEYVLNHAECKALILGSDFLPTVEPILTNIQGISKRNILVVGNTIFEEMTFYEKTIENSTDEEPSTSVDERGLFTIIYTSGTTGFPKGAAISHRARVLFFLITALEWEISDQDINLNVVPLYHAGGLAVALEAIYIGGATCIMESFEPRQCLEIIERERTTWSFFVPTMFTMILNLPEEERKKYDVSSMRVLISGGAPLLTKTKEEILALFKNTGLNEFYGATESPVVVNLKPRDIFRKNRCVGKPLLGTDVKILDEKGNEVSIGEVGELYTKNLMLMDGYYKETKPSFKNGYFSAGDLARKDEEGYYYIVDRKIDMIISGGVNIYPVEIEEVISKHPKVAEVAVIGVPDDLWGESVKAVIVLKQGEQCAQDEIIRFCEDRIAGYKKPKSVDFVREIPKNPSGKILKREIRKKYWEEKEVKI